MLMSQEAMVPDQSLVAFLFTQGLAQAGEHIQWTPLAGGVSSDIWQVELPGRSICIKRALPQLKVSAEWLAPVNRNNYEWAWMKFASQHCPDNVPRPLAQDESAGLFAMDFLPPEDHPVWKQQLLAGEVETTTAQAVGTLLGQLHAASARNLDIASTFDTIDNFYALRLEPYLVTTATRHPDLSSQLIKLVAHTAGTQHVLVHGDVSPKNILVGPKGPVLLDAECAWYGDPAFDLVFCLNHMLLKCLVRPDKRDALMACFQLIKGEYLKKVNWESPVALESRAARLLPALLLARVDGKSPVEYLTDEGSKAVVRSVARQLILKEPQQLDEIAAAWEKALGLR